MGYKQSDSLILKSTTIISIKKGKAELLIKQLLKKFKNLPAEYEDKIMNLPINAIDKIGMDIFDINSVEELEEYFKI